MYWDYFNRNKVYFGQMNFILTYEIAFAKKTSKVIMYVKENF